MHLTGVQATVSLVLGVFSLSVLSSSAGCLYTHFRQVIGSEKDDYIIYGLTQDCQLFFIRSSQLRLLEHIKVNPRNSYCYPNLVQLHILSHNTLLLLIRQGGNRVCSLVLSIPPAQILFGDRIFSYSLVSSLPYAGCSHTTSNEFLLEVDLSFPDPAYKELIYMVDSRSEGDQWTVRQFRLQPTGTLEFIKKLQVDKHTPASQSLVTAKEFVFHLDAQRNYLYKMSRLDRSFVYECAFDLLYKKGNVKPHEVNVENEFAGSSWLNSIGVDGTTMIISESIRHGATSTTFLQVLNTTESRRTPSCLAKVEYAVEVGIVRTSTLDKMRINSVIDAHNRSSESSSFGEAGSRISEAKSRSHVQTEPGRSDHHRRPHHQNQQPHTTVAYPRYPEETDDENTIEFPTVDVTPLHDLDIPDAPLQEEEYEDQADTRPHTTSTRAGTSATPLPTDPTPADSNFAFNASNLEGTNTTATKLADGYSSSSICLLLIIAHLMM